MTNDATVCATARSGNLFPCPSIADRMNLILPGRDCSSLGCLIYRQSVQHIGADGVRGRDLGPDDGAVQDRATEAAQRHPGQGIHHFDLV